MSGSRLAGQGVPMLFLLLSSALAGVPTIVDPLNPDWVQIQAQAVDACAPLTIHADMAAVVLMRRYTAEALIETLDKSAMVTLPKIDADLVKLYGDTIAGHDLDETRLLIMRARSAYITKARDLMKEAGQLAPQFMGLANKPQKHYRRNQLPRAREDCAVHFVATARYYVEVFALASEQREVLDTAIRDLFQRHPINIPENKVIEVPSFSPVMPDSSSADSFPASKTEPRIGPVP